FFFQAEDGIRDYKVTGVQTCALPICAGGNRERLRGAAARAGQTVADKEHLTENRSSVAGRLEVRGRGVVNLRRQRAGQAVIEKRSEERRVGKEGRSRGWTDDERKKIR